MNTLDINGLHVTLPGPGHRTVLRDVSFSVAPGEALGLVGESGSGKSMTLKAVLRMLPTGSRTEGAVRFEDEDEDVYGMDARALRRYRSHRIAMIHQDPRATVNPVRRVGDFLTEGLVLTHGLRRREAAVRMVRALADVGIADGERRMAQYPHELSGGLLQRVMIAAALATGPRLLLADEPTTALDVTTQQEVMAILDAMRRERGLAMVFVTHDLDLAAAVTDRVAVMYAGTIVETGPSADLHHHAAHPYTAGLLRARPVLGSRTRPAPLPGRPVSAFEAGDGCGFADRCTYEQDACRATRPALAPLGTHTTACHRAQELADTHALEPAS
ncbi:ABC transporter ATP-binding protein [Streptomyces sp. NPDC002896]|uniref:ABC transporter ATP-binding protein n=1 Tax=Streptomyces sp. NPDC002896 TaxID=3154438 RepID=UPI00332087E2